MSVRAWPFESKYLRDFAVVEERQGHLRLLPATEQLPLLSKAIDQEFYAGLTTRLASTDARGDPWRKLQLREAALAFSGIFNLARPDHLHVQPYYTTAGVTQIAIVQQITEPEPNGNRHWFRQFRGTSFLPDVYLSCKRIVFSGHALTRFAERAMTEFGHPVIRMLTDFWNAPPLVLQVDGHSSALVYWSGDDSLAIQPFEDRATEFFILTTLNPHQTKTLTVPQPLRHLHLHYCPTHLPPSDNGLKFSLEDHAAKMVEIWKTRPPHPGPSTDAPNLGSWTRVSQINRRRLREKGHNENSGMVFYDNIHGPSMITYDWVPKRVPASRE